MKTLQRNKLRDIQIKKVFERLKEKLGPQIGVGDAMYCCEPLSELISEYNTFVEKTEADNEGVTRMLDAKDLDIDKLRKENEKFLDMNGGKESW